MSQVGIGSFTLVASVESKEKKIAIELSADNDDIVVEIVI